jgi:hypothetical protein
MSTQSQIDQINDERDELADNLAEVEGRARLALKNQRRAIKRGAGRHLAK